MSNIINKIKFLITEGLLGLILREIKYRRRLREMRKRDPFIY